MFRTASIVLMAVLAFQAIAEPETQLERRGSRGPAAAKGGFREQRRPEMNPDMAMGHALRHPKIADRLGLSEEQRQAIEKEQVNFQKTHGELRAKMEKAALKQARLMTAEELDESALMAAVEETGRIHTEMAKLRIRHLLFMRKTLTPKQIEQARTAIRSRMKSRHEEGAKDRMKWKRDGDDNRRPKQERPEEAL